MELPFDWHGATVITMEKIARVCAACGGWEHPDDPLCVDRFDDDEELIHFRCYNSARAVAWREERRAEDPTYDRYLRLTTPREPVHCPHCSAMLEMSSRVVGMMGSMLPVNCTKCHRATTRAFSFGEPGEAIWAWIDAIRADFVRARHLDSIDERLREVAREYNRFVDPFPCKCGGQFSLAAKPRCPRCEHVAFDTYFHVIDDPLSEEQRKRPESLFGGG
jgi:hypothetical protein